MKIKYRAMSVLVPVVGFIVVVLWLKQIGVFSPMEQTENRMTSNGTDLKTRLLTPAPDGSPVTSAARKTNGADQTWNLSFATPIIFYGKVIDENRNPIPGANVKVSLVDHPFGGNTERDTTSDANGLFRVIGHGLGIAVTVSKDGYFHDDASGGNFGYINDGGVDERHTDPGNPAILLLRKRGKGEKLIKSRKIVRFKKDGTPIMLDLANGKLGLDRKANIVIEVWTKDDDIKPNSNQQYEWGCRLAVPGGGVIERGGAYDFLAPEDGYVPNDEIDMPVSLGANWRPNASREYFVKFPGDYHARIELEVVAEGDHFFIINSYFNPTPGSLNLEEGSAQQ